MPVLPKYELDEVLFPGDYEGPLGLGGAFPTDSPETEATTDDEAHHPDEATDADLREFRQRVDEDRRLAVEPFSVSEALDVVEEVRAQGEIFTNLRDYRNSLLWSHAGRRGPNNFVSMAQKQGIVIHFAGPAQNRSLTSLQRWQAYARYHVNLNWGGGWYGNGIMYHCGAGDAGEKGWFWDFRYARWHVGVAWHNTYMVGLNVPVGQGQRPTRAQLTAIYELVSEWLRYKRLARSNCIGHLEANPTECPGLLMDDFVRPYRAGGSFSGATGDPQADGRVHRVQLGAYSKRGSVAERFGAEWHAHQMRQQGYATHVRYEGGYWRVQLGAFEVEKNATDLRDLLIGRGIPAVVRSSPKA